MVIKQFNFTNEQSETNLEMYDGITKSFLSNSQF
jgi:hypothetical protein